MGQWVDYRMHKPLCQRPLGWFAHHTYSQRRHTWCPLTPLLWLASLFLSPSSSVGLSSSVLSFTNATHPFCALSFLPCRAVVLQPKESVEKVIYDWEAQWGPVDGASAQEHWWPGARGPAGIHPSTCPPLHSVWRFRMDLCCPVCPLLHTGHC